MEAAKRAGAPKPGRKIPFVGDRYTDFIPDYYLGIAYLNLKRYAESEKAFESVRASGLIGQRDPEYAQFQTQFNTARSSALQALGKVDVPVTNDPRAKADVNEPKISPPIDGAPVPGDRQQDRIVTAGQPPPAQRSALRQQPLAQTTPSSVQSAQSLAVANAKTPPFGPTNKTTPPNPRGNRRQLSAHPRRRSHRTPSQLEPCRRWLNNRPSAPTWRVGTIRQPPCWRASRPGPGSRLGRTFISRAAGPRSRRRDKPIQRRSPTRAPCWL